MQALVFDIFGDLAHFRRFYTTSSPLTFSFPPPPTIAGMLGAIIGIDKTKYLEVFSSEKCKISVRIVKPIKKIRIGLNLINTKGNFWIPTKKGTHEARTQIRTEFIKDPYYRIYISHEDNNIFNELISKLSRHESFFTISLGLSELLADFNYIGVSDLKEIKQYEGSIYSLIPMYYIRDSKIIFEDGKKYFKERVPIIMNSERKVEKYDDVIFEAQGYNIKASVSECWEMDNGEHILFF
jgi:CRISPR-associated protein Cas5h